MAETTYHDLIVQALQDQQAAVDALAAARTDIAAAITEKGVDTPSETKFSKMAAKIAGIKLGATIAAGTLNIQTYSLKSMTIPCTFDPTIVVIFTTKTSSVGNATKGICFYYYYNGSATAYSTVQSNMNYYAKSENVNTLTSIGGVVTVPALTISNYDTFVGTTKSENSGDYYTIVWQWLAIK